MTLPKASSFNVTDFWQIWSPQAPGTLNQPILPWTLSINSHNSTAPQTEADIVARYSYGRQIGRISDALHALILDLIPERPPSRPLEDFMLMWNDVENVKLESAKGRLAQIASDLALLKKTDLEAYKRLRDDLDQALERTR